MVVGLWEQGTERSEVRGFHSLAGGIADERNRKIGAMGELAKDTQWWIAKRRGVDSALWEGYLAPLGTRRAIPLVGGW